MAVKVEEIPHQEEIEDEDSELEEVHEAKSSRSYGVSGEGQSYTSEIIFTRNCYSRTYQADRRSLLLGFLDVDSLG
ncbi:hypothetical protein L1987_34505 [Smallanthus sonchifolius]|uniref:Uncharacterized protein n=1 Tax=Smallanthus sonchifolius TaxID=185202 RepID=A0ACB9HU04_9ASTR|nr:hypothetical protein L1987_34505 [Smallanthus sonchifolius]